MRHSDASSPGHGPERCGVPEQHVRGGDLQPPQHLADPVQPAAPQRGAGEVALERPEAERVDDARPRRRSRRRARPRGADARAARPASATQARADAPAPGAQHRVLGALRERVHPRVERREDGLVVVGRRAVGRQPDDPARHRAGGQALERRHGGVQVERSGRAARRRRRAARCPGRRASAARAGAPRRAARPAGRRRRARCGRSARGTRRLGLQPGVDPARHEPVVVVAGRAARAARRPARARGRLGEAGPAISAASRCGASRSSSPSPRITSRSTSAQRRDQRRAQLGAAQRGRRRSAAPRCRSEMTRVRTSARG